MAYIQGSGAGGGGTKKKKKKKVTSAQQNKQGRGGIAPANYHAATSAPKPAKARTARDVPIPGPAGGDLQGRNPLQTLGAAFPGRWSVDATPDPNSTEGRVRALTDPYFKDNHAFPDGVTIAQMMSSKNGPRTQEQYDAMWGPMMEANDEDEQSHMQAGDFFQMHDPTEALAVLVKGMGIVPVRSRERPAAQIDQETIDGQLTYIRHINRKKFTRGDDFLGATYEIQKVKKVLAQRLEFRGAHVPYDPNSTKYDKDFEMVARKYIFGRQLAYALYGSAEEQAQANKIIESIRRTSYGRDKLEVMAGKLGLKAGEFDSNDTAMSILSAMKYADDDIVRSIAFDGWQFGRPIGQSAADARKQYAELAGVNRLPMNQGELYAKENAGFNSVLTAMGNAGGAVKNTVYNLPIVGRAARAVGALAATPAYWLNLPIEYTMRGISTVGEVLNAADKGMYFNEYMQELAKAGGEDNVEELDGFDWGSLIDAKTWSEGWQEAEGKTPVSMVLQSMCMKQDGALSPWAVQVGQLGDLGVMLYVGAKAGDPLVDYSIGLGLKGAWHGARMSHKMGYKWYEARGEWLTGQDGFLLVESGHSLKTRAKKLASGQPDELQPPPVHGIGSLRPLKGGQGVMARVVPKLEDYLDPALLAITAERGAIRGKGTPVGPKSILLADKDARATPSLPSADDVIIRPFTFKEFQLIEPPIPGTTYHGGAFDYNPLSSRHRAFGEGAGLYTSDDAFMAAEYNARWAEGFQIDGRTSIHDDMRPNMTQYIEGQPKNPFDFDATADESFWRKIVWDLFHESKPEYKGEMQTILSEYHPRSSDGIDAKGNPEADRLFDEMLSDVGYDRSHNDKKWSRELKTHTIKGPMVKGLPLSNQELFMHIVERVPTWFHGTLAGRLDKKFLDKVGSPGQYHDTGREAIAHLVQESLFKRGYDAQTHVEGHLRTPHNVVVWFKEAVEGDYVQRRWNPKKLKNGTDELTVKARMRHLLGDDPPPAVAERMDDWSALYRKYADQKEARGEKLSQLEKETDNAAIFKEVPWNVMESLARENKLWDGFEHINTRVAGDQLLHEFRGPNGVSYNVMGKKADVVHIKGALKSWYGEGEGPRLLTREEAYNKYMEKFNDVAEQHADDAASKIHGAGSQQGSSSIDFLTGGWIFKHNRLDDGTHTSKVQPYAPPQWLQTNAEMLSSIDDDFQIARVYGIAGTTNARVKQICAEIASSKDMGVIADKLRELETHGITIDGGGYAGLKYARIRSMESQFSTLGFGRIFGTMTTYGKRQPLDGAADSIYNVGRAIKLGDKKGRKENMKKLDSFARRAWRSDGNDVQAIVDEMWDTFEKNLGEDLADYKDFNRQIRRAQGRSYIDIENKTAYHGVRGGQDGAAIPMEGSKVLPPDQARILAEEIAHTERLYSDRIDTHLTKMEQDLVKLKDAHEVKHGTRTPKQGLEGSAEVSTLQKRINNLKRDKRNAVSPGIKRQQNSVMRMAEELGATPAELDKIADAVRKATDVSSRYERAAQIFADLGDTAPNKLSKKQRADWKWAEDTMDTFSRPQPFRQQQLRQTITHRYDPRIAGWYMTGKNAQHFMKADQALFEPLMRVFKETVMASLAFPFRVNIGDELIRLIPEGVVSRWVGSTLHPKRQTPKQLMKQMKADGHEFTAFESALHASLARDWDTAGKADDWTLLMPRAGDTGYVRALKTDLSIWRKEPIMQALINHPRYGGKGKLPDRLPDMKRFIKNIRDKRYKDADGNTVLTDEAATLRGFLDDTHRSSSQPGGLLYDTRMFDEWVDGWEDRMTVLIKHPELRQAMTGDVSMDDLSKLVSRAEADLWPVNTPQKTHTDYSIHSGNPIYALQPANVVYHNIYKYGTVPVLGAIGRWTKETIFADRYYRLRGEILDHHAAVQKAALKDGKVVPDIDPAELHEIVGKQALDHAQKAGYSQSTTMFEDMTRNMLPFISAYRQFWVYWAKTTLKHPVSMSVFKENYPEAMEDPFRFHPGDMQLLTPAIPFWGPTEEGATSTWDMVKGQLPTAGFIPAVAARTGISALGGDPELFANLPLLSGLGDAYAPFRRQGQLAYGLTGWDGLSTSVPALFGSPEKLEKAHTNAVLSWLKYGANDTGADINMGNAPGWAKAVMALAKITRLDMKPEALYNEFLKSFLPINAYYSPVDVWKRQQTLSEYGKVVTAGDEAGAAKMRASDKFLDTWLTYYESTPEDQVAMKRDPKNSALIKWWVSPYNYDEVGNFLEPSEWRTNLFANGRDFANDAALVAAVHNLYTNVYGGTYVKGKWVTAGTEYKGDIRRADAEKKLGKLVDKRLEWAKGVAKSLEKNGLDSYKNLMYMFRNPGPVQPNGDRLNWGVWNAVIAARGLKPYDYDIEFMKNTFLKDFGSDYKVQPFEVSSDTFLKLVGLSHWVANPKDSRQLREATPYRTDVRNSRRDLREQVQTAVIGLANNQWYDITGAQLSIVLGKTVSPKIDVVQSTLKAYYNKKFSLKAGSTEYREWRNSYYALQSKLLGKLSGGKALVGGLDDRLEHIPYFTEPQHVSIGAGPKADAQLRAWATYKREREAMIKSGNLNQDRLDALWEDFTGSEPGEKAANKVTKRVLENGRIKYWTTVLNLAHKYRAALKNSYSDYYEAKGNSVETNIGKKYAKELNSMIAGGIEYNPLFASDIKKYFGNSDNVGGHLIDWYAY